MCVLLICVILAATHGPTLAGKKSDYDLENWMGELSNFLDNKIISEIVIPGTHNSGSYPISIGSRITNQSELAEILNLDSIPASWITSIVGEVGQVGEAGQDSLNSKIMDLVKQVGPGWSKCQEHSIPDQLKMGNRYLDLRVYCDKETDEYYLEHFFMGSNFTDELLQIADFVESHEEELLILDIKSVQDCSNALVTQLLERMEQLFNNKLVQPPIQESETMPTYGQLVAGGTTVIVSMCPCTHDRLREDIPGFEERFSWLWDRRTHVDDPFANTSNIKELKSYIRTTMSETRTPRSLYVSQIILTPTIAEYLAGLTRSGPANLQVLAAQLNKKFLRWIRRLRMLRPNIFITDFSDETLSRKVIKMNFYKNKDKKRKRKQKRKNE